VPLGIGDERVRSTDRQSRETFHRCVSHQPLAASALLPVACFSAGGQEAGRQTIRRRLPLGRTLMLELIALTLVAAVAFLFVQHGIPYLAEP
jgi:hypothetical protein